MGLNNAPRSQRLKDMIARFAAEFKGAPRSERPTQDEYIEAFIEHHWLSVDWGRAQTTETLTAEAIESYKLLTGALDGPTPEGKAG